MLPEKFSKEISTLCEKRKRFAVSLSIIMNKDGIVDFRTLKYHQQTIEVAYNLDYKEAETLILEGKC
jgi:exoribonuclease R